MNFTKKVIILVLLVLFLIPLSPKKAQAQYVDIVQSVKEYAMDTLAWQVANVALNKVTAQTVNWINSGFQGSPAFVMEPGRFFLDLADNEASRFLSANGVLNQLCVPFRANVRLALVKNYLDETDGQNYSCTLGLIMNNYDQFTQDFSQGGWDSWFQITQNNSNNPYGAYLEADTQLQRNIDSQVQKYTDQLNRGRGFLSFERCPAGEDYIDPATGKKECWGAKETVTPGSAIQGQLDKVLGTNQDRIVASDEINEIVGALLNQFVNMMFNSVDGLLGSDTNGLLNEPQGPSLDAPEGGARSANMRCDEDGENCVININ